MWSPGIKIIAKYLLSLRFSALKLGLVLALADDFCSCLDLFSDWPAVLSRDRMKKVKKESPPNRKRKTDEDEYSPPKVCDVTS